MKSPKRSALAYVAEYHFGDDNLLTATFHEEQRLHNEARVRNAQPAIRLRDISLSDDDPVINNAKRLQQDQGNETMELTVLLCIPTDRRDVIEQHNMLLLERLEKIHQQHVPRQFDVSHLSDEVLNAPRASNAGFRRKQQRQIERENEKLQTRLLQARSGTLSNKKLALDADKHRYLAEQISKVARRRKVRERCQALSDQQQVIPAPQAPAVMMAAHTRLQLFNDESYIQLYDQSAYEDASSNAYGLSGSKSLSRLDGKKPGSFATLPQIHQHEQNHYDQHEQHIQKKKAVVMSSSLPAAACSPTLTHTTKLISALDLPRGLRNTGSEADAARIFDSFAFLTAIFSRTSKKTTMQLKQQPQRPVALRSRAGAGAIRHFHATQKQPVWFLVAGAGCAALFLGSRYVVRAQERIRRKREGLPVDDDDADTSASSDSYARRGSTPAKRMTQILGVDFGTANLRLSVAALQGFSPLSSPANSTLNSNLIRVIESADGLRAIPAAVAVDNGSVSVGVLAKALLGRKPGYTGTATRLLLEHNNESASSEEWNRFLKTLPYKINVKDGEDLVMELDGKTYSPEWAAEIMLDYIHSMAARSLGENGGDNDGFPAIISVPPGLSDAKRDVFERVASSAGFQVITSVDDPIAALYAVELSAIEDEDEASLRALSEPGMRIAVFDMGGYKASITLLERESRGGAGFKILESRSSSTVSGKTVDDVLFSQVVSKFQQENGIDLSIDHMASYRVLEAVETAKIELSSTRNTDLNLPFITADRTGAKHLVQKLSAYDLSRACEGQVTQAKALCDQALAGAGLTTQDVDLLVLVGGGVRSEPIREHLEKHFGKKAFSGRNFKPEEAVVVGAAEFGRRLAAE